MSFATGLMNTVRGRRGDFLVVRSAALLAMTLITLMVGCANQAKMANDPFRRTGQKGTARQLANDPRYAFDTSDRPTDRANAAAREKDFANDINTDPADEEDEEDLKEAGDEQPFKPASSRKPGSDPLVQDEDQPAVRRSSNSEIPGADPLGSSVGQTPFADYEKLRARLDAAGATNWKFDKDDVAGETTFSCEAAYPNNPTTYRVFEAKSKDELKAMLAVAEQVERWSNDLKQQR